MTRHPPRCPDSTLGRRAFLRDLGLATAGLATTPALLAACGGTTTATAGSQDPTTTTTTTDDEEEWKVDGAVDLAEVIITSSPTPGNGSGGPISIYDANFGRLRQGTLRTDAHLPDDVYEHRAPTLSFPYIVEEGGSNGRRVLRRVDLETGTDEVVFTGEPGRGIHRVVANPATGEYVFAYSNDSSDYGPLQLWRASPGASQRIPYEDSFLDVVDAEHHLPVGLPSSPFGGVFPVTIDPDGTRLLFIRWLLYSLDLASGQVELFESNDSANSSASNVAFSPDGTRLAVAFDRYERDSAGWSSRRVVVVIDLASGDETEIRLPAPLEAFDAAWHPDGRRVACKGYVDLEGPGTVAGMSYSSVFLVDTVTGETQEVPRNPAAPSSPPQPSEFRVEDVWNHNLVGFSRDGATLLVQEARWQPIPPSQTTTTSTPPTTWGQPGLDPPPPFPYEPVAGIVAIDVGGNTRLRALDLGNNVILAHR